MVVKGGELIEYKGSPIDLIFSPAQLKVKSFRNSSIEYSVPQIHNYQRIQDPEDPICLAELGVKFYADFLDQIEGRF